MITYQVEAWSDVIEELRPMWDHHWKEIAMDHHAITLAPDFNIYAYYEDTGALCVITAREDGIIVGYHILIVRPHLHYMNDLHAFTDVYYVRPDKRKGWTGIKLFKFTDKVLKQRGVKKVITATKIHLDMSRLFTHLGYRETERVFTKVI